MSAILCNIIQSHSNLIRILFLWLYVWAIVQDVLTIVHTPSTSLHSVNSKIIFICIQAFWSHSTSTMNANFFSLYFIFWFTRLLLFFLHITLEHFIETEYINLILRHWIETRSHFHSLFIRKTTLFILPWLLLIVLLLALLLLLL